jgi:hypothetical protein
MRWLNLSTSARTSPEFIGSEPTDRATWLCLILWCAEHETSGRVSNCANWGDRRWMQTFGITRDEIVRECDLWAWEGDDLVLWGYPHEQEALQKSKREGGRIGGVRSGEARRTTETTQPPEANPDNQAPSEAVLQGVPEGVLQGVLHYNGEGVLERKGKEGKGKEGKEMELPAYEAGVESPEASDAPISEILNAWNEIGNPFARVLKLGKARRQSLKARLADPFFRQHWRDALARLKGSAFCRGETKAGRWIANFDWFLRPGTVPKLIEGNYDDNRRRATTSQDHAAGF